MKHFGFNIFLFSILMGLLLLPIASFKLAKVQKMEVLGEEDTKTEYLQQKITQQEDKINELENQLRELTVKETSQSTESILIEE